MQQLCQDQDQVRQAGSLLTMCRKRHQLYASGEGTSDSECNQYVQSDDRRGFGCQLFTQCSSCDWREASTSSTSTNNKREAWKSAANARAWECMPGYEEMGLFVDESTSQSSQGLTSGPKTLGPITMLPCWPQEQRASSQNPLVSGLDESDHMSTSQSNLGLPHIVLD
jgi:hypothetical protein